MFAGIVEELAVVVSTRNHAGPEPFVRLTIESSLDHSGTALGDSISISGACLTVVEKTAATLGRTHLSFDAVPETLRRTTLGSLNPGDTVNLERSLVVGSRLHGHFVSGHVDALARLVRRAEEGNAIRLDFELPSGAKGLITQKGSVALGGVSLTVGPVSESQFTVWIIPHTAAVTTLGMLKPGDSINLEFDMVARYVWSLLQARAA